MERDRDQPRKWDTYDAPSSYVGDGGVSQVDHQELAEPEWDGPYREMAAPSGRRGRGVRLALASIAAGLVVVVVAAIVAAGSSSDEPAEWDARTPAALRAAAAALEARTGSTQVFEVAVDENDIVMTVPVSAGSKKALSYEFRPDQDKDRVTSDEGEEAVRWWGGAAYDMTTIDARHLKDFCEQAEAGVENPTYCTVKVALPSDLGQRGFFLAGAVDRYQKWSEVAYDRNGRQLWSCDAECGQAFGAAK